MSTSVRPAGNGRLDETIDESFPASDPPANTPATGILVGGSVERGDGTRAVQDNERERRFETTVDGHLSFLRYDRTPGKLVLIHTEVSPALRGRGVGNQLVETALATAKAEGRNVVPICPFVQAYMRKRGLLS